MTTLAILGGEPIRKDPYPSWPVHDEADIQAITSVVRSGNWGRLSLSRSGNQALPRCLCRYEQWQTRRSDDERHHFDGGRVTRGWYRLGR